MYMLLSPTFFRKEGNYRYQRGSFYQMGYMMSKTHAHGYFLLLLLYILWLDLNHMLILER